MPLAKRGTRNPKRRKVALKWSRLTTNRCERARLTALCRYLTGSVKTKAKKAEQAVKQAERERKKAEREAAKAQKEEEELKSAEVRIVSPLYSARKN
jgi:hypothetical protein